MYQNSMHFLLLKRMKMNFKYVTKHDCVSKSVKNIKIVSFIIYKINQNSIKFNIFNIKQLTHIEIINSF